MNSSEFALQEGMTFTGLADGTYSLQIYVVTLAGLSQPTVIPELFSLQNNWLSKRVLAYIVAAVVLFFVLAALLGYYFTRHYLGEKLKEYDARKMIINPEYLSQMELYTKDEWELQRDQIETYDEIGKGNFGNVFMGKGHDVKSQNGVVFGQCAVKTIAPDKMPRERLYFLLEAHVMKQFNTAHIVQLYGVISDPPVMVVMELMANGSLRDFLARFKPEHDNFCGEEIKPIFYFRWAAQIADGMSYLEASKFVHRDLAARNCMVDDNMIVKIGDFGFARDVYYKDYYRPEGNHMMPVRWMSPEALRDGRYTNKSDVWSYGVVMYEMMTLGAQPYAGLGNDMVFNYVVNQRRVMVKPTGCPDFWYVLS